MAKLPREKGWESQRSVWSPLTVLGALGRFVGRNSTFGSASENMRDLPTLPQKLQNEFEAAKARAELEYATRAERFPHHPGLANNPIHLLKLIQDVVFTFCEQAREACRQRRWTVAKTRQATETAITLVHAFYISRDVEGISDEERALHLVRFTKVVMDDPQWKGHLSDLATLAKRVSITRRKKRSRQKSVPKNLLASEPPVSERAVIAATPNNERSERQRIVDAYIEDVLTKTGNRISRADIWKRTGDKSRTEFERWESFWYERCGKKTNRAADRRFVRLLLTEKPHLK